MNNAQINRYHDWVRAQPCEHCGVHNASQLAHYEGMRAGRFGRGMGKKAHFLMVTSLCGPGGDSCHQKMDQNQLSTFEDQYMRKIDKSEMMLAYIASTHLKAVDEGVLSL